MGEIEENIIRQAIRENDPIPEKIANKPDLQFGLEFYLMAWTDLNADRTIGLSLGPIPSIAILQYAAHMNLNQFDTRRLLTILRIVDSEFLKHVHAKNKK